jgi:hypothetical protein
MLKWSQTRVVAIETAFYLGRLSFSDHECMLEDGQSRLNMFFIVSQN